MRTPLRVLVVAAVITISGCNPHAEFVAPVNGRVALEVEAMPSLPSGHYELRASFLSFSGTPLPTDAPLHEEEYVILGDFVVGADGHSIFSHNGGAPRFEIPAGKSPRLVDELLITVRTGEAHADTNATELPVIVAGKMRGDAFLGVATLTCLDVHALGSDFATASGSYTLTAPTSDPADSNSGIWFLRTPASPQPGLVNLPVLPEDWVYEGWVKEEGAVIRWYSTGRFRFSDSADFDGAGPGRGPGTPYSLPGQDFITGDPARPDLSGSGFRILVTVEPATGAGPAPSGPAILSNEGLMIPPRERRTRFLVNVAGARLPRARVTIEQ